MSRRELFALIGAAAGSGVMYQAMTSLGHALESNYRGPLALDGDPKGASVLVLGAGLAGMTAAYELRKAGYAVEVLEFSSRVGGRCLSLRGGDRYVELSGVAQECQFDAENWTADETPFLGTGPRYLRRHHTYQLTDPLDRLIPVLAMESMEKACFLGPTLFPTPSASTSPSSARRSGSRKQSNGVP